MKSPVTTATYDGERTTSRTTPPARTTGAERTGRHRADARRGDADLMAIASFVAGLVGLLVFNVVLGPCALVLGATALARGTDRRFRALLGCALGCADLVLLAVLSLVQGTPSWHMSA
ncbi:DUF4190 domain-containing protein [Streptomyces griseocarneus]|uniref:DUF4190 domain-containing protein n=1 Tax=Streptomyces griseocarneus TaxID=51201 RepID=UPI00167D3EF0|nr:DUF4190 domain-containing protein [Streptomyces griseocarneus]MBZ6475254.1 DUF4190 domain-containing protein [Streptomyces griseocarneus]GHG61404.1 hypothetical protein GCM10018779_29240 [Streptomyces griseocarneus]